MWMMENMTECRTFAIVCAAGKSARMGTHKLLLSWQQEPIIAHVLRAWVGSRVTRAVVVVRPDDAELIDQCRRFNVDLVFNQRAGADMKTSVQAGLEWLAATYEPSASDAWILAPADVVRLNSATIDRILAAHDPLAPSIVVPVAGGKRGHPVLLPWSCAAEVHGLGAAEGVNAILSRHDVRELDCHDPAVLDDLDTREDYERLVQG